MVDYCICCHRHDTCVMLSGNSPLEYPVIIGQDKLEIMAVLCEELPLTSVELFSSYILYILSSQDCGRGSVHPHDQPHHVCMIYIAHSRAETRGK